MSNDISKSNIKEDSKRNIFNSQEHMPEGCPPKTALEKEMDVAYRFILEDSIKEHDFFNHIEANSSYGPPQNKCSAIGLSFFTSLKNATKLSKRVKKFRNKNIMVGKIKAGFGRSEIQNGHINLWVYKDVILLKEFNGKVLSNDDY